MHSTFWQCCCSLSSILFIDHFLLCQIRILKPLSADSDLSTCTACTPIFSLIFLLTFSHFILSVCQSYKSVGISKKAWAPACCLRCLNAALQSRNSFLSGCAASPLFIQSAVGLNRMSKSRQTCCDKPLPVSFVGASNRELGKAALTSSRFSPNPSRYLIQSSRHHMAWITTHFNTLSFFFHVNSVLALSPRQMATIFFLFLSSFT